LSYRRYLVACYQVSPITHSSIDSTSLSPRLEEHGFVIVPQVLESEAVDNLVTAIERCLTARAGDSRHALRNLGQAVPLVQSAAECGGVRLLVEQVLGPEAVLVRSLFFDKTSEANWKVAWHQDLTIAVRNRIEVPGFSAWSMKDGIAHVQPPVTVLERMLTVRLHLDDCDSSNGPLLVIPGSHKAGRLNARQIAEWRERKPAIVCPVERCGSLLMRPLLLHASSSATQPKHRRVVHLEFAATSLPGGLEWLRV